MRTQHSAYAYISGLAVAGLLIGAPQASAQRLGTEESVNLQFDEPVQVPGTVLPAGEYEFSVLSTESTQSIVEIRNAATHEPVKVLLTVPAHQKGQEPDANVVVAMLDAGRNQPPALYRYFYPNSESGHELVYPSAQARTLADRNQAIVMGVDMKGETFDTSTMQAFGDKGEARNTTESGGARTTVQSASRNP